MFCFVAVLGLHCRAQASHCNGFLFQNVAEVAAGRNEVRPKTFLTVIRVWSRSERS